MKSYIKVSMFSLAMFAFVFSFSFAFAREGGELGPREDGKPEGREFRGAPQGSQESVKHDLELEKERAKKAEEQNREEDKKDGLVLDEDGDEYIVEDVADAHQKVMKDIFENLGDIEDGVPGLGKEIREVARNEASSTEERVQAIHDIQNQSSLSRFFFGPDKEKVRRLNDEIKVTADSIDRLNVVKTKMASTTLRTKLDEQISALEVARSGAEKFVKENQEVFSIFGFFSKLFGN